MEYYLSINNSKVGPFSEAEIVRGVQSQKISLFDMIFNQQINDWVMIMQHPDFSDVESDYDEELDQDVESMGSLSQAEVLDFPKGFLKEDNSLKQVSWYLKTQKPAGLQFMVVLAMIHNHQISEQTLIAQSPEGPWKQLVDWIEFSEGSLKEFETKSSTPILQPSLRRKSARITFAKNLLVLTREKLSRVFCLDVSGSGLSLILRQDLYSLGAEIYLKLNDSQDDSKFDVKGRVISARKVKLPGYDEDFIRYGVRFTHVTKFGRATLAGIKSNKVA